MPTFNRLQSKHPDAVLRWFQNGKLWGSQREARDAQERRGQRGRKFDPNQQLAGDPRTPEGKLDWKPKGSGGWKPKRSLDWKPKGSDDRRPRPKLEWSPKQDSTSREPDARRRPTQKRKPFRRDERRSDAKSREKQWDSKRDRAGFEKRDRPAFDKRDRPKLEWSPRPRGGQPSGERAHKAFSPDKRSKEPPRDSKWRPGGEHRDPRQKYKDAKKAKWTRFKDAIRRRSSKPRKP